MDDDRPGVGKAIFAVTRVTVLTTALTILLTAMKMMGLDISWWWVFAPFWLPYAILIPLAALTLVLLIAAYLAVSIAKAIWYSTIIWRS